METHVTSGVHCLLLQLDPVIVNLACFMVWNGCHLRSAIRLFIFVMCEPFFQILRSSGLQRC